MKITIVRNTQEATKLIVKHQDFASNLFLLGVNAGPKIAIMVGQRACNIIADGIIGKQTIASWKTAGDNECKKFTTIEIEHYKSLIVKDKRFFGGDGSIEQMRYD